MKGMKVLLERDDKEDGIDGTKEYNCTICSKRVNGVIQINQHNNGKQHKSMLEGRGLSETHGLMEYIVQWVVPPTKEPLVQEPLVQVLFGKHASSIIDFHRSKGIDIPLSVKCVVKVTKKDYIMTKDFDFEENLIQSVELVDSVVLVDGEKIIGVLVCHAIPMSESSSLCERALKLYGGGGFVERSADKMSPPMAMFGWRFGMEYSRYFHPIQKRCKASTADEWAKATELELYADKIIEDLNGYYNDLFPNWIKELQDLYKDTRPLGKMGSTPFSGIGITENYTSVPHLDVGDCGYGFITWLTKRTQYMDKGLCAGGEFILPEYGVYFRPQHGTVLAFMARTVYHGTRRNVGFTQVGICSYTKMKLVRGGQKRKANIGLD